MHLMRRRTGFLSALYASLLVLVVSTDHSYGQTSGSGLDTGLQILQGLSPEQRAAITQGLGGTGLGGGSQSAVGARVTPQNEEQLNLMLREQREQLTEQQRQRSELERLSPFLQGEDWVVITIDTTPLPGAAAPAPGGPSVNVLGGLGTTPNA